MRDFELAWAVLNVTPWAYTQGVFEAVRRSFLIALAILLPPLAEQKSLLMQEQVPLHWLEPGQIFHLGMAFFVLCPHAEGALHQQTTQLWQVTLKRTIK